jgi:co-chaperonin GroES (HSP10)
MKPLHHFIVRLPNKFKEEIKLGDKTTLKLVTKFNEFEHRFNYGEIVGCPVDCPIDNCTGKTLYFHHHVVMEQMYDIGEDLYLVNYEPLGGYSNHAIAVEGEDGDIVMLGDWCFVTPPIEKEEETSNSGIILTLKKEPELEGELLTIPQDSEWIGAKPGDLVGYTKNSEYEMELLNGEKVYRMRTTELVYVKEA